MAFQELPVRSQVVLDERSAAHWALGAVIATGAPAFAVCTSGTAALNYGPAVAEAFYQQVPLLVITADRPAALIDNGHGQSIRQTRIFDDHLVGKGLLDCDAPLEWNAAVIDHALQALKYGPVHLNVPLAEPLYEAVAPLAAGSLGVQSSTVEPMPLEIPDFVRHAKRPLLVVGQWNPSWGDPEPAVRELARKGWAIAAEPLSQLPHDAAEHLEDTLAMHHAKPDAVVTLGGPWVAKKAKAALVGTPHWAIGPREPLPDMFGALRTRTHAEHFGVDGVGGIGSGAWSNIYQKSNNCKRGSWLVRLKASLNYREGHSRRLGRALGQLDSGALRQLFVGSRTLFARHSPLQQPRR